MDGSCGYFFSSSPRCRFGMFSSSAHATRQRKAGMLSSSSFVLLMLLLLPSSAVGSFSFPG